MYSEHGIKKKDPSSRSPREGSLRRSYLRGDWKPEPETGFWQNFGEHLLTFLAREPPSGAHEPMAHTPPLGFMRFGGPKACADAESAKLAAITKDAAVISFISISYMATCEGRTEVPGGSLAQISQKSIDLGNDLLPQDLREEVIILKRLWTETVYFIRHRRNEHFFCFRIVCDLVHDAFGCLEIFPQLESSRLKFVQLAVVGADPD